MGYFYTVLFAMELKKSPKWQLIDKSGHTVYYLPCCTNALRDVLVFSENADKSAFASSTAILYRGQITKA